MCTRVRSVVAISALLLCSYATCSSIGSAVNSVFLHVNNVAVDCSEDAGRLVPYYDALLECAHDVHCCFVSVEEFDVHAESPGLSRLCYSCTLLNVRAVRDARISIKGSSIYGNISKDFQVRLNKQGICERDQLLSELSPVLSVNAATRECLRTGCDYFTMATLEGIEGIPGTVNKAWFCSGSPKTVDSDGFITAVRKRRNNEL